VKSVMREAYLVKPERGTGYGVTGVCPHIEISSFSSMLVCVRPNPKFLVQRDPRFRASGAALPGLAGWNPSGIPVPVVCDHSYVVSSGFPARQTHGGRPAPPGEGRA
jgi:hypothetical protein